MVARDLNIERISSQLHYAAAMLAELHEQPEYWPEMPEWERADWSLEWAQVVNVLEQVLAPACDADDMTPDQRREYQTLLVALQLAGPLVERLGLTIPQVSVDTAA